MHRVIVWPVIMVATVLLVGCSEPLGIGADNAFESTSVGEIARRKPSWQLPDSVGIPPSPFPPIIEELPPVEESP
jgi:hypothetical protein